MELKEMISELIKSNIQEDSLIAISFIEDDELSPEEKAKYINDILVRNNIIDKNYHAISDRSREILYALSDYFVKTRIKKI